MIALNPVWEEYELFDSHSHISGYSSQLMRDFSPESFISYVDKYGLVGAAVSKISADCSADNKDVHEFVKQNEGRGLVGVAHINPNSDNAIDEIRKIADLGFKGVKMHPDHDCFDSFDLKLLEPILGEIAKHKLPILFHTGTPPHVTPMHVGFLAQHFTEIPMICGHSGLGDSTFECLSAARMAENVYFDTALASTPPVIENLIAQFGADRVLWGTDVGPYGNFISQFFWVYSLDLTEDQRAQVYCTNAKKLFSVR